MYKKRGTQGDAKFRGKSKKRKRNKRRKTQGKLENSEEFKGIVKIQKKTFAVDIW